jgi:hypothetical protein
MAEPLKQFAGRLGWGPWLTPRNRLKAKNISINESNISRYFKPIDAGSPPKKNAKLRNMDNLVRY